MMRLIGRTTTRVHLGLSMGLLIASSASGWAQKPLSGQALIDRVRNFAPIVALHPDETHFPMAPSKFIMEARLRRHRDGFLFLRSRDDGYNTETGKWDRNNSHDRKYFNPPLYVVRQLGIRHGRNRRPYDSEAVDESEGLYFLETRKNLEGVRLPTNRVPVFFRISGNPIDEHYYIQYLLFYGYNQSRWIASFSHQEDWEHVTVEVLNQRTHWIGLSVHDEIQWHRRSDIERQEE